MLFLGRERELRHLTESLDRAVASRGSVHLLMGEPGIGKTRLADEVARAATERGLVVAWGRAWETGGAPPFYPWTEILGELGGEAAGAPSLEAHGPARGESTSADSPRERFAVFDAVVGFLRSRPSPLLLVLDDLHAADLPSIELLHFVARGLRSRRIVVVATLRDAEGRRGSTGEAIARVAREATSLTLHPLGADDVGKLVEEHTGKSDAKLTSDLVERTEGNPLFIVEALRALDDHGEWATSGILGVIASRIDGLDPETSRLLEAASVFGRRLVPALLAATTQIPITAVLRRLEELTARGILRARDNGHYFFSHALVRDAFYERIAAERRREIHREFGITLQREGAEHAALAAHHLLAALPRAGTEEAIRAAIAAAEAARARLAPEDAVTLLDRTMSAVEDLGVPEAGRIELLLALGWAATDAGALARGRLVFREAARRAATTADPVLIARAALGQGGALVFGEVREELIAMLRHALAGLQDAGDLRARLLARLAAALQPSTTPEEPIALALEAIEMGKGASDPRIRAEIAHTAGSALVDFAPPKTRIPVAEELIRTARELDDAALELRGLTRLATDWIEMGDFARAETVIEARAELAARIGHPRYLWQTPLLRSMLAMPKGQFAICDEAIEEAVAIGQEALDPNAAHVVATHRFWMLLARGDVDGLRRHEPEILRAMNRMPEPAQHHALVRAVIQARSGDAETARASLRGIGDGRRMLAPMMLATIAEAALAAEDTARLPDLYAKLAPARGRFMAWGPFAFTCREPYDALLGALAMRLGKTAEAEAHLASARELERRSGAVKIEAKAPAPAALEFTLRMERKDALVVCGGRATRLRALRGLPMLARLVEQPGREMHVLDLAAEPEDESAVADRGDAGEILDAKARETYQQRIADLRAEVDEADRFADIGRADRARRELDLLVQQLSAAVGLGGRARRTGSAAERARITVQRRVREAIKRIAEHEPELGRHLDWAVRTGTFCAYEPAGRKTAS